MTSGTGFHGISFRLRDRAVRTFEEPALAAEIGDPEVFSWIDLEGDAGRLLAALDRLGVDRAVADRLGAPEVLPGIVERANAVAFRLYEVEHPDAHLDTSQGLHAMEPRRLLVVLGTDFVLTWHPSALDVVADVRREAEGAFRLAGKTPAFVAFLFLQRCLYDYADLNLANDNYLDGLEPTVAAVRGARARRALERGIATAAANILTLKKLTTNLHVVCMLLATKRTPFVTDEARSFFHELQENARAVRTMVDGSRDLLDGVVGALHAESAARTSRVAGVLTAVSVVMLPLGLIAGLWGMNFAQVPMSEHPQGFWWVVGGMAALAAVITALFLRLGWIGR